MNFCDPKILLLRLLTYLVRHFMRASIREKHYKIRAAELVLKVGWHLCEYLRFAVIAAANLLVFRRHAVVAAYNHNTHKPYSASFLPSSRSSASSVSFGSRFTV